MESTILELLAQPNITQADVASVLNVSASYISQIVNTPAFQTKLSKLKVESLISETAHDSKLATTESKALAKVEQMLDYITKPMEAAKVFQVLNAAKRRGASEAEQQTVINSQNTVVMLQLPNIVKQKFTTNNNNEVVQIGDRPMVTMDSQLLLSKTKEKDNDTTTNTTMVTTA